MIVFFLCHQDKKKFTFFRAHFFISSIDFEFERQNAEHDTEETADNSWDVKCGWMQSFGEASQISLALIISKTAVPS